MNKRIIAAAIRAVKLEMAYNLAVQNSEFRKAYATNTLEPLWEKLAKAKKELRRAVLQLSTRNPFCGQCFYPISGKHYQECKYRPKRKV